MRVLEGGDEGEEGEVWPQGRCVLHPDWAAWLLCLELALPAGLQTRQSSHTFHHLFVNSLIQQIFIDWFSVFGTLADIVR